MKRDKIVFIHMLNNFSGSPNVLSVVADEFVKQGFEIEIITNKSDGFLSNIPTVNYRYISYKWCDSKLLTLFYFIIAQIQLFFMVLFLNSKNRIYYINTIVPFGAALACKLSGKRLVYHSHENMSQNRLLYRIYATVYKWCNQKTIFVSKYVESTALNCRDGIIVYNGLSQKYFHHHSIDYSAKKSILMVCSLRLYKGIYEFVELSKMLPEYEFELVVSDSQQEVDEFQKEVGVGVNLKIYARQTELSPFYSRSKLLLSLSHPDKWVETFGLTIAEAMCYATPSIVPNAGGPMELIADDVNGYIVSPFEIDKIAELIKVIFENNQLYERLSTAALASSRNFRTENMIGKIKNYIFA